MARKVSRRYLLIAGVVAGGSAIAACSASPAGAPAPGLPATTEDRSLTPTETPGPTPRPVDDERKPFDTRSWRTDFSKRSIPLHEIQSGGPPKDGIPAIDGPKFVTASAAATWLRDNEPVAVVEAGRVARAYPLQILIWHEIVNDTIGELPVTVTFCPLCNTAIAFDRRVDALVLDFGTTGNLRHSDLVMYDRQTETWWQQATGEAIIGELTGKRLTMLPALVSSFGDFRKTFDGEVLSRETGFNRAYGSNPYVGYDSPSNQSPFLFSGKPDGRLRAMERVVAVSLDGVDVAYPFGELASRRVVHDTVGRTPIVIFFRPGTASALDQSQISESRDVGSTGVFLTTLAGRRLGFRADGDEFVDAETGSRWTLFGRAVGGPLTGQRLTPVVHGTHFWFAWAAFQPGTRVHTAR
ncbi:MAG: DUF3179 domain-containing protein [Chloroflexi bacterium]|nr:DUF3179 domain-containing protein [Chloroflexota bacterium]